MLGNCFHFVMMLLFLSWFLTCNGTKWPKLCLCAVKKLLTHSCRIENYRQTRGWAERLCRFSSAQTCGSCDVERRHAESAAAVSSVGVAASWQHDVSWVDASWLGAGVWVWMVASQTCFLAISPKLASSSCILIVASQTCLPSVISHD